MRGHDGDGQPDDDGGREEGLNVRPTPPTAPEGTPQGGASPQSQTGQFTESQLAEKALLDSLSADERMAIIKSKNDALEVAASVLPDLQNVLASQEIFRGVERPEIVDTEYWVKEVPSLARKFINARIFGKRNVDQFLESVNDRVRFSVQMPVDRYGEGVVDILHGLVQLGYSVTIPDDIKNFWKPGNRHLGLNVTVRDPDGFVLEIQFPTATSRALGKKTHQLYEDLRLPSSSPEKRVESLLGILWWNRKFSINEHIPQDLSGLPTPIDTTFLAWTVKNPVVWQQYLTGLEPRSFRDEATTLGLRLEDIPGGERWGLRDDDGDIRIPRGVDGGRSTTGELDRGVDRDGPPAPGGPVEPAGRGMDLRAGVGGAEALRRSVSEHGATGRSGDREADSKDDARDRPARRADAAADVPRRQGDGSDLGSTPKLSPQAEAALAGEAVPTNSGRVVINGLLGQIPAALGDDFAVGAHYLDLFEYEHERRQAERLGETYDVRALAAAHGRTDGLGNPDVIMRAHETDLGAYGDLKRLDPDLTPDRKDVDFSRRVEKRLREPFGQDARITVAVVDGREVGLTIDAAVRGIRRALGFWRQQGREVLPEQRMIVFTGDGGSVVWRGDTGDINVSA